MNRKQRIIVSITGIFIVMLALVGLTYAYFLTRITGNEAEKSISITTANLELRYDDASEDIILDGAMPNTTRTKTFTVTNNGNAKVTDYQVYLENVVNELERNDDLVYTLTCETNDETNSPCTNEIDEERTFPSTNGTVLTNSLDTDDVHTYTLTLTYKEMNVDQSVDMNKRISAKINIYDKNDIDDLTLGHYILSNGALVEKSELQTVVNPDCVSVMGEEFCIKEGDTIISPVGTGNMSYDNTYEEKLTITKVSDGTDMTDVGIFTSPDDYGTSYYYRGTVKNNYVDFAGFTWRIVRINGDGSIRLILNGTLDKTCVEYNADNTCKAYAGKTSYFNSSYNDNVYVGYMYGYTGGVTNKCLTKDASNEYTIDSSTAYTTKESCEDAGGRWAGTPYETTHINKNSSTIKTNIDTFYETYIENGTTKQYERYLSDTMFCGDKSLASSGIGNVTTQLGYGTNNAYYAATGRLMYSSGITSITIANPTLKCASGETNTYSRYTVEEQNRNNVLTNGDLKHPIALLSADELVMAGAFIGTRNLAYYLYDSYANATPTSHFFSLSPSRGYNGSNASIFISISTSDSLNSNNVFLTSGVRPVINLRSDVLIESGDGTSGNGAYKVRLANG